MHDAARKDLQMDYRNFLDQQKWGNATLKLQMQQELTGNPNPRRNGAHAMLPPKPAMMPPQPMQFANPYQNFPYSQMPQPMNLPPYGVDAQPASRNVYN